MKISSLRELKEVATRLDSPPFVRFAQNALSILLQASCYVGAVSLVGLGLNLIYTATSANPPEAALLYVLCLVPALGALVFLLLAGVVDRARRWRNEIYDLLDGVAKLNQPTTTGANGPSTLETTLARAVVLAVESGDSELARSLSQLLHTRLGQ